MLIQIIISFLWSFLLFSAIISFLFSFLSYLILRRRINLINFFMNLIQYSGQMAIQNTNEKRIRIFRKINNSCIVILWSSLLCLFLMYLIDT